MKVRFNHNIGLKYFFSLFEKRRTTYPKGYFLKEKHRKKRIPLQFKLFKSIVSDYFDVYFIDFYNHKEPIYFPLSGKLKKAKGKSLLKTKDGVKRTESIVWIWFLRPAYNFVTNIKLTKTKGSTSMLNQLEREHRDTHDISLLPFYKHELENLNINQKLFKTW